LKEVPEGLLYEAAKVQGVGTGEGFTQRQATAAMGHKEEKKRGHIVYDALERESKERGGGFLEVKVGRGVSVRQMLIVDGIGGNEGLEAAVEYECAGVEVQRCPVHKLRNLARHTPRHVLEEVKSDYHRIIQAESLEQAKKAYREFVVKWKKLAPKVVVSLEEAGEELLTFYSFPNSQRQP